VGDKTFGVICQRERVFPKSLAKPRSGGETPSRAGPSCPAWRSHANKLPVQCAALRLLAPYLAPARGEGIVTVVQCAPLIGTLRAYFPQRRRGGGTLPLLGALSPGC
jgi:hypothetical protein